VDGGGGNTDGMLYCATGKGTFDLNAGGPDAGDTVVKRALQSGALVRLDYFPPFDAAQLSAYDSDFGAGGPFLPSTQSGAAASSLVIIGGKDGKIYVVNRNNMGKFNSTSDND